MLPGCTVPEIGQPVRVTGPPTSTPTSPSIAEPVQVTAEPPRTAKSSAAPIDARASVTDAPDRNTANPVLTTRFRYPLFIFSSPVKPTTDNLNFCRLPRRSTSQPDNARLRHYGCHRTSVRRVGQR